MTTKPPAINKIISTIDNGGEIIFGQEVFLFLIKRKACLSNNITPEKASKQSRIHPRPGVWQWDRHDKWIDFANKNDLPVYFVNERYFKH